MTFRFTLAALPLALALLASCATTQETVLVEIPAGHPANPQSSPSIRSVGTPRLSADASTLATTRLLNQEPAGANRKPIDHGAMDHGSMNQSSGEAPTSGAYTCSMHPEIHTKAPGNCTICGMKLVKEKPSAHAH